VAVAIRKIGDDQGRLHKVTCRNCASVLEYLLCDVKEKTTHDYDGGSDIYRWIECPQCKQHVVVRGYS
jgi:hypothetical protein